MKKEQAAAESLSSHQSSSTPWSPGKLIAVIAVIVGGILTIFGSNLKNFLQYWWNKMGMKKEQEAAESLVSHQSSSTPWNRGELIAVIAIIVGGILTIFGSDLKNFLQYWWNKI